jgi:hypothetical protein
MNEENYVTRSMFTGEASTAASYVTTDSKFIATLTSIILSDQQLVTAAKNQYKFKRQGIVSVYGDLKEVIKCFG